MKHYLFLVLLLIINSNLFAQTGNLKDFIEKYARQHEFNGTILVQKGSKPLLYHQSFGTAERAFNTPITNQTIYQVCSITKTFTAVLILQLVEKGEINLDKTIIDYLPSYKAEAGTKVSIHQLLNHTSGMKNIDTAKDVNFMRYGIGFFHTPYTLDEIVNKFCSDPLVNEPGTKFDYNNGEYMILGRILEEIYKLSYEQILNRQILVPLGMGNSGLLSHYKLIKNLATPYYRSATQSIIPNLPVFVEDFSAAGAMYSCTADLIKFNNALFDYKLIKKETLAKLLTPGLNEYGYSVWIRGDKGPDVKYKRMERYGRIMGANAAWFHYLNGNVTVIILSNTNFTDLGDFAMKIGEFVF